ncbi:BTB/POZ domain-containing protein At5g41330 [Andrographis paniculata]|uniref:BTB/POZ domain-containing protein At5g41330 n=1 Tax=Andrographis paniculata TaxID=175694 RepID=UPI0021E70D72|nr:BTB/POZ domain-containing protein At5g41330 [Andrographis paniculata]
MPPFGESNPFSNGFHHDSHSNVVTIDVGGQIFQTTKQTLSSAGPKSLLSKISSSDRSIPFIDRDPELFSILLSLLRTGNLPSKAKAFDIQDLIFEAQFYGIESILVNSQSNPSQIDAFNLEKSLILPLNGRDSPSAISTTLFGSLHVAHGSKVTSFDWSLRRKSTILTQFTAIDSLLALSPAVAAAGATDFSGLQIIDLNNGIVKESLDWVNVTKSGSTVQAIGASDEHLFTSFESSRRNSSCIMIYDLNDSLRPAYKIGHYEIFGADLDSAIPATKLQWITSHNLLMASGSHSGPAGVSGNIKFWDIRSGNVAWELKEKTDCFSDIAVSDPLSAIFKVGINSGETYYADLRYIQAENSWTCLGDPRKGSSGKKGGLGSKVETHGSQVVCGKGGNLELWSEVLLVGSLRAGEKGLLQERVFRKNMMGRAKDMGGNRITNLRFGGNKLFVTRKDQQCVEVWM